MLITNRNDVIIVIPFQNIDSMNSVSLPLLRKIIGPTNVVGVFFEGGGGVVPNIYIWTVQAPIIGLGWYLLLC